MRISWWPKIILVKLLFQTAQRILMQVIIEMIFSMQMLNEISHSFHHIFSRNVVDIGTYHFGDLFQIAVLIHVAQSSESVSVNGTFAL